jgi:EAL domain-containing protein (putative c-di-GMP-specific phosphodiesterase class I)
VIDLQAHRHAASVKAHGNVVEEPTRALTPGEVWDALNDDRLVIHYQPQYDMRTGETIAAEALVRLVDGDGQLVYPDRFITLVEQSDLIVPLGRAVIEQVCADLAVCRTEGSVIRRMAINLSARQLNIDTTLLSFIDQVLAHHGLKHSDLEFELTERQSLTPHCEGLAVLDALAERGARIVIDDFGIGYSSIVYLAELPVTALKLDRALVSRLPDERTMQTLVESLLALAVNLDLDVIAEGIETNAQNEYLVRAGCPYAQGYGYAKPMYIADLLTFMSEGNAPARQGNLRFSMGTQSNRPV